jgi:hypothetical protein
MTALLEKIQDIQECLLFIVDLDEKHPRPIRDLENPVLFYREQNYISTSHKI